METRGDECRNLAQLAKGLAVRVPHAATYYQALEQEWLEAARSFDESEKGSS